MTIAFLLRNALLDLGPNGLSCFQLSEFVDSLDHVQISLLLFWGTLILTDSFYCKTNNYARALGIKFRATFNGDCTSL